MSFFKSSIGKKVTMSLTGLFLISFLVIHLIGNLQILKLDDGYAFNSYAKLMTSNPIIKTVSYLLYASILYHAFMGIHLVSKNRAARKEKYAGGSKHDSPWTSRYMGILGTIIFVFIIVHMGDFWREYKFDSDFVQQRYLVMDYNGEQKTFAFDSIQDLSQITFLQELDQTAVNDNNFETYKDMYSVVRRAFESPLYVLLYVLSMLAILFHLWHGFKSAFQTLGVNHPNVNGIIAGAGKFISVVIMLAFAFIPLYIYFTK